MSTIKNSIEGFLYPFIERYTEKLAKDGEDTVIEGIRVLDEESAFTHGALIHATAILYIHYIKKQDPKAQIVLEKLNRFIDIVSRKKSVQTWGKLAILRALNKLKKANLLDNIDQKSLNRLNELTDYDDFLDKEAIELLGYPTNYFQVALACAAYREALGFDHGTLSDRIEERFISLSFPTADAFMDDELGYGRYDRYTLVLSSEISDLYRDLNRPLPEPVLQNLAICAKHSLFMANIVGDGFNYGRSLSVHGDLAPAEILASALSRGAVKESDKTVAIAYIFAVLQKLLYFWFNSSKDSFDIWWNGRTTNDYRQIHRLLEVNMDMVSHIYALFDNIVAAGLENESISALLPYPETWEYDKISFNSTFSSYTLRYKDFLCMLPFIGTRKLALVAAYNPFPAICGFTEGSPTSTLPFLIPEYTSSDGKKYRPAHFTKRTEEHKNGTALTITAYGNLMRIDDSFGESDIEYRQDVTFVGKEITVEFEVFSDMQSAEMFTAENGERMKILVGGFKESTRVKVLDNDDFKTPHGSYTVAHMHYSQTPKKLGYKAIIEL